MAYASVADMVARFGDLDVIELTDRSHSGQIDVLQGFQHRLRPLQPGRQAQKRQRWHQAGPDHKSQLVHGAVAPHSACDDVAAGPHDGCRNGEHKT